MMNTAVLERVDLVDTADKAAARAADALSALQRDDGHWLFELEADATIPAKFWMDPSEADAERYVNLMRDGRIEMAEKGFYDKKGLKIIKRIRCDVNPSASDCTQPTETWQ